MPPPTLTNGTSVTGMPAAATMSSVHWSAAISASVRSPAPSPDAAATAGRAYWIVAGWAWPASSPGRSVGWSVMARSDHGSLTQPRNGMPAADVIPRGTPAGIPNAETSASVPWDGKGHKISGGRAGAVREYHPNLASCERHALPIGQREASAAAAEPPGPVHAICAPVPEHDRASAAHRVRIRRLDPALAEDRPGDAHVLDHHGRPAEPAAGRVIGPGAVHP